jgi:hypothetical protein
MYTGQTCRITHAEDLGQIQSLGEMSPDTVRFFVIVFPRPIIHGASGKTETTTHFRTMLLLYRNFSNDAGS